MGLIDLIVSIFAKYFPPEEHKDTGPAQAAPEPEPEPVMLRWLGDMVPRSTGPGERIERSGGGFWSGGSVRLEWVSRRTDGEGKPLSVRTPESHTMTMPEVCFIAAGKQYLGLSHLARKLQGSGPWYRDVYDRCVLAVAERFPCFDSSDYLYEDRYFRWFFLCQDGKLTCVYHTDRTKTVTVTEDVRDIEQLCWRTIERMECFKE